MQTGSQRDHCAAKFIAALFTIAKTRKPPKSSSMNEWIKMAWCIYAHSGILCRHEKEGGPAIFNNGDGSQGHDTK